MLMYNNDNHADNNAKNNWGFMSKTRANFPMHHAL